MEWRELREGGACTCLLQRRVGQGREHRAGGLAAVALVVHGPLLVVVAGVAVCVFVCLCVMSNQTANTTDTDTDTKIKQTVDDLKNIPCKADTRTLDGGVGPAPRGQGPAGRVGGPVLDGGEAEIVLLLFLFFVLGFGWHRVAGMQGSYIPPPQNTKHPPG